MPSPHGILIRDKLKRFQSHMVHFAAYARVTSAYPPRERTIPTKSDHADILELYHNATDLHKR